MEGFWDFLKKIREHEWKNLHCLGGVIALTAFKRKVLITGGYGFLGQAVAERFLKEGWDVFIIDDVSSPRLGKISSSYHFYPYSVTEARCEEIFRIHNLDVVIHNAERSTSFRTEGYMENSEINFLGLVNMLHLSSKYGSSGISVGKKCRFPL